MYNNKQVRELIAKGTSEVRMAFKEFMRNSIGLPFTVENFPIFMLTLTLIFSIFSTIFWWQQWGNQHNIWIWIGIWSWPGTRLQPIAALATQLSHMESHLNWIVKLNAFARWVAGTRFAGRRSQPLAKCWGPSAQELATNHRHPEICTIYTQIQILGHRKHRKHSGRKPTAVSLNDSRCHCCCLTCA